MNEFPQMVAMLHKSVAGIVEAAPENRDALIATSFAEFEAMVAPEMEKVVAAVVSEQMANADTGEHIDEPLYKGLGCVGKVANLIGMLASRVEDIIDGEEGDEGSDDEGSDGASDQVAALLEHMIEVGELALRAAVNEHMEMANDDDDVEDGMQYVKTENAEDPGNPHSMLVLKTALPMELAKYACDNAALTMAAVQLGSNLLLEAGVDEAQLSKAFDVRGATLAKAADDMGQDGGDPGPGAGDGGDTDPTDIVAQVEILGRIAAASLMQVDHVLQLLGASTDENDGSQDDGSQDPAQGAGSQQPPMGKSADLDALRDDLTTQMEKIARQPQAELDELKKEVRRLAQQPAAGRAVLGGSLTKSADTGGNDGTDGVLEKLASELDSARSDDERNRIMLKAAIKLPGVDLSALRKN